MHIAALSRFDGLVMISMFLARLATTIIEARKQRSAAHEVLGAHRGWRHDEISPGTTLGSNTFNGIFIVVVAVILCPIVVAARETLPLYLDNRSGVCHSYERKVITDQ